MDTTTTSSFGHPRKRRKEKAQRDAAAQLRLWLIRLQEIMEEKACDPRKALGILKDEVLNELKSTPQRKEQIRAAWLTFLRMTNQKQ